MKIESAGVFALLGDDYPYAVPVSYVYFDSKLYFHGAKSGHKIDAIKKCDKDDVIPEEYTTYFRSVIAFEKIRIMEEEREKERISVFVGFSRAERFYCAGQ